MIGSYFVTCNKTISMNTILFYIAGALTIIWGTAHLFPTKGVIKEFGDISKENKNILAMEWINEGVTLIFLGILTLLITVINPYEEMATIVYWSIVAMLVVLSIISLFTGFKVNFLPYKLCPVIFTLSAVLIILGMYLN